MAIAPNVASTVSFLMEDLLKFRLAIVSSGPADQVASTAPLLFVFTARRPSEPFALGNGPSQPLLRPLNDKRFLELRNCGQDAQEELPRRCGGIYRLGRSDEADVVLVKKSQVVIGVFG